MEMNHGLRIKGAMRILPSNVALAGASAAWHHGVTLASASEPVHVLLERKRWFGPIQRVKVHTSVHRIEPDDFVLDGRIIVTSVLRTAWDLACWLPTARSVQYLDAFIATGLTTREELRTSFAGRPSVRGCRRARTAVEIADGRAESPAESSLRAMIHSSGLPAPTVQYEIRIDGRFIARVDLAWPDRRVALEYEGAYHASTEQMARDRARLSRISSAGWKVVFATRRHVYGDAFEELLNDLKPVLS